jgi:hypothetical protein
MRKILRSLPEKKRGLVLKKKKKKRENVRFEKILKIKLDNDPKMDGRLVAQHSMVD